MLQHTKHFYIIICPLALWQFGEEPYVYDAQVSTYLWPYTVAQFSCVQALVCDAVQSLTWFNLVKGMINLGCIPGWATSPSQGTIHTHIHALRYVFVVGGNWRKATRRTYETPQRQ